MVCIPSLQNLYPREVPWILSYNIKPYSFRNLTPRRFNFFEIYHFYPELLKILLGPIFLTHSVWRSSWIWKYRLARPEAGLIFWLYRAFNLFKLSNGSCTGYVIRPLMRWSTIWPMPVIRKPSFVYGRKLFQVIFLSHTHETPFSLGNFLWVFNVLTLKFFALRNFGAAVFWRRDGLATKFWQGTFWCRDVLRLDILLEYKFNYFSSSCIVWMLNFQSSTCKSLYSAHLEAIVLVYLNKVNAFAL